MKHHFVLALGWILFCVWHSLLADLAVKQWLSIKLGRHFKFFRLYYTLFALASFCVILFYQFWLPSFLIYQPTIVTKFIGLITGISGLVIMTLCIIKYFKQLSGLTTLFVNEVKSGNTLIISGIHRYVRHPLYAGTFLFIWGLFIFLPFCSILISNFIITVYTLVGIKLEEKKLLREFGEAYKKYRKTVPMLIPGFRSPIAD